MGGGTYSYSNSVLRTSAKGYATKSTQEIFKERNINSAMNPYGVNLRESCDSEEHPNSLPIIIALDVTGSMGSVPHFLVKEGFPEIMDSIIKSGIPDPQVLFLGIGDHECDAAPLQVGQFESSDELLDKWLTTIFLEGGGGGNNGESYLLAWYFAGYHTRIDSFDKRNQKGFLFTIGDEPTLNEIPKTYLSQIMGEGQYENYSSVKLLEKVSEKYHVFHIHIKETSAGSSKATMNGWKQLMGDNLIISERRSDVSKIIINVVTNNTENVESSKIVNEKECETEMML